MMPMPDQAAAAPSHAAPGAPDLDATLQSAVGRILRVLKITETRLRVAHRELAFGPSDIQTLRFLSGSPGAMLTEVAAHLGVAPTTAASVVDRLVRRSLVARVRPEANRRVVALDLTDLGRDAQARIDAEERETMRAMLGALPEAERAVFVGAVTRIAAHLESIRGL
jgi:DNA-binding MarR family transcriptional regulator